MKETAMDYNYKGENAVLKGMFREIFEKNMLNQGDATDEQWFALRDAIEDIFGITIPAAQTAMNVAA